MNLLSPLPEALLDERIEVLARGQGDFRLERIVSRQHASPPGFWYDQDTVEWVFLLQGSATLSLEESDGQIRRIHLKPGDFLELPAHVRHRVDETDPVADTVWVALHGSAPAGCGNDAGSS